MRRELFCVVFCLVLASGSVAVAKDPSPSTQEKPKLVPTVPPPTAEWPDFPGPDAKANEKPGDNKPAAGVSIAPTSVERAVPEVKTPDSTAPASSTPGSTDATPPAGSAAVDAGTKEAAAAPPPELTPAQMEPHKRPVPEGYAAAAELYKQKKFSQAAKAFETIIQKGAANVDTHLSLAYCYLLQRIYSKAVKEFEWVEKYGKNSMTLQKQAGRTAISLRIMMSGVCPAPCLKANDPRWHRGKDGRMWITIRYSTSKPGWNFSEYHIGEYVANENGLPVLKGKCPICDGTGRIRRLKDGDPPPRL